MGRIEVNPAALERAAAKIKGTASDLAGTASRMNQVKDCVEQGWQSSYTGMYISELEVIKNNLNKLSDGTQELAEIMKNMAAQARRTEEENKAMFGGGNGGGGR